MKQKMFAIKDAKAEVFNLPYSAGTHAEAERSFRAAVNDPQTTLNRYPEDFDLWYLGEYDTHTGVIQGLATPLHVMKAIHALPKDRVPEKEATPVQMTQ